MDMTWSTLDHKENSMNAGPLFNAGFLTDMYIVLVILCNYEFQQLEMGNRHLAFFAGNHLKTWKTESLNVITDLTTSVRGEKT